jgi:hypothetical protein
VVRPGLGGKIHTLLRFEEDKYLFPLPGVEPRFSDRLARSLAQYRQLSLLRQF